MSMYLVSFSRRRIRRCRNQVTPIPAASLPCACPSFVRGYLVNRKRVYRLYKAERLMVRRRGGRKRALGIRAPILLSTGANERWSLDFVHDQMVDGRRFRILAVVDDCTREAESAPHGLAGSI